MLIAASGAGIASMRRRKPGAVHLHADFRNGPHHVAGIGMEGVIQDLLRPAQLHLLRGIEHADLTADLSRKEQIVGDAKQGLLFQTAERLLAPAEIPMATIARWRIPPLKVCG